MSDHWICIIPGDPEFIPTSDAITKAEALMAEIAPNADEISIEVSETVPFRDYGGNVIGVYCPVCNVEIEAEWWGDKMSEAYRDGGFCLEPIDLPCGHQAPSLNDLRYDWEQGFSRFAMEAMNANIGTLTPDQITGLEAIFGHRLKVIYRHI